ncbi:MAG: hypothetical protein ACFFCW_21375 [Candidatus Hodarchaeota archaeon]
MVQVGSGAPFLKIGGSVGIGVGIARVREQHAFVEIREPIEIRVRQQRITYDRKGIGAGDIGEGHVPPSSFVIIRYPIPIPIRYRIWHLRADKHNLLRVLDKMVSLKDIEVSLTQVKGVRRSTT